MAKKRKAINTATLANDSGEISDILKTAYMDYSIASIARALPVTVDGLIGINRRFLWVLYNMNENKLIKSARIVGDVLGKYHPHGDTSAYGSLVTMAQSFKRNRPLVTPQGNWGSIDGDAAAHMRYTECKMSEYASEVYFGDEVKYVDFTDNYDNSLKEPVVLCPKIPTLLVHGVTNAISVGFTASIPQHNLNEVCDATISYIKSGNVGKKILGPDLPTGGNCFGIVQEGGISGIERGLKNGKGKVYFVPDMYLRKNKSTYELQITSLPGLKPKNDYILGIINTTDMVTPYVIVTDKKTGKSTKVPKSRGVVIDTISKVEDMSNNENIDIRIIFKRGTKDPMATIKKLRSVLIDDMNYSCNTLSYFDKSLVPQQGGVKYIIGEWYRNRVNVLNRYFDNTIINLENKLDINRQLEKFLKNYKKLSLFIVENDTPAIISEFSKYGINENGVNYILDTTFKRIKNRGDVIVKDIEKIQKELDIFRNNKVNINQYIISEITAVKKKYGWERRTKIRQASSLNDIIKDFDVSVMDDGAFSTYKIV